MQDEWQQFFRDRKLILWGTSIGARQAVKLLDECGLRKNILAYVDNAKEKWGTNIGNVPVFSPSDLFGLIKLHSNAVICITSIFYDQISRQIRSLGVSAPIYVFLWYNPCELKSGCKYDTEEKRKISSCYDLKDEYTSELIEKILDGGLLNARAFGSLEKYKGAGGVDAYFYEGSMQKLVEEEPVLTLLDVGSYDGLSVKQMENVFGARLKIVHAFEPSADNFAIMQKNLENRQDTFLHKLALSDMPSEAVFTAAGPFFRLSGQDDKVGAESIECAVLDNLDLLIEGRPILKLDVEGMEMKALRGAENFIRQYRPILVVCVYHRDDDIAEIPHYVKSLIPDYKSYLRGGMHTVAYFI